MANYNIQKSSPILVTGSAGFIGKNLVARLCAMGFTNVLKFDVSSTDDELANFAKKASFVFHLAGVNRPKNEKDFHTGNTSLTQQLLNLLHENGNKAPVVLASSAQVGNGSAYAQSKENAELLLAQHTAKNNSFVFSFRLPGVFGKWCRPSYNSVVATFCHNIANGQNIEISNPNFVLNICYIDDVIDTFLSVLDGEANAPFEDGYYGIHKTYSPSLQTLANTINGFLQNRQTLKAPNVKDDFTRKLYSTFLSYLPNEAISYPLEMNIDERGSFTEFLKSDDCGQVSVNVAKKGVVKGNHWHDTKTEKFLVVAGKAIVRQRLLNTTQIIETIVSSEQLRVVDILPGYTHNIENVGENDLVTLMWASEAFNPKRPDTWFEKV